MSKMSQKGSDPNWLILTFEVKPYTSRKNQSINLKQ